MNGYEPEKHKPLPGWDEWHGVGGTFANFNYTLNENGKLVHYGSAPQDHLTDVLARKAAETIRHADPSRPLFVYIAPYDPHSPATPTPRHAGLYVDEPLPQPPSFDEADVSDKASYVRNQPPLQAWQKEALTRHNRERLRALRAVDDMVETVVDALRETGRLDSTYVVYSSDNGFHMGQHRLFVGKTTAYEEDIHVPLIVRGPGVPAGQRVSGSSRWCSTTISHPPSPPSPARRRRRSSTGARSCRCSRSPSYPGARASRSSGGRWRPTS
jgi:N-acetylglucosamine-6-sulfatase